MFWRKNIRKLKQNKCFGAKSLENQWKPNVLAQTAQKTKGKPQFWRNKEQNRKPKENLCFGSKAQKTKGKHVFLHKKLATMLAIAKLAKAMVATAKLAKSKLAKSKACKSNACKTSAYKSKASHNNKARKTLFGVLAPVSSIHYSRFENIGLP